MPLILQVAAVASCAALFAYVISLVKRGLLQLRYSLLWLVLASAALLCTIFPAPLFSLAEILGFTNASNFIFFCAALFLLSVCLNLSSIVSRQSESIKRLTQRIALLEHDVRFSDQHRNGSEG